MPPPFRLAVVGAGPSAFYAASRALSRLPEAKVDLFDRLWAPHGLVRYGVAPDHPEVKNCIHKFDETSRDPRCRFFGNVTFATRQAAPTAATKYSLNLPLSALFPHYTHLLIANGASLPNTLPSLSSSSASPESPFVTSALSLVHWYTGHPLSLHTPPPPLSSTKHLTLIGHGNVSLDIARLLLASPDSLAHLDIPQHVLETLKTSSVEHVNIVSRRGPAQVAFTAKELREMMALKGTAFKPLPTETFDGILSPEGKNATTTLSRQQTRILDLMRKGSKEAYGSTKRTWSLEFFRTPVAASTEGSAQDGRRGEVTFDLNALDEQGRARPTGEKEIQRTDLIATSLGYHSDAFTSVSSSSSSATSSEEVDDAWYDPILRRIRTSSHGRVMDSSGRRVSNVYASGWAAHGSKGVIASSMYDAYDVADTMVSDYLSASSTTSPSPSNPDTASSVPSSPFESAVYPMASPSSPAFAPDTLPDQFSYPDWMMDEIFAQGGKRVLTYDMWLRVDAEERKRGEKLGKVRERLSWKEVDRLLAWEGQPAHPDSLT